MLFKRKKDVDLRDLQKKGLIRVPKKEVEIETDRNGFIDLGKKGSSLNPNMSDNLSNPKTEPGFFNFFENSTQESNTSLSNSNSEKELRELTRRFEDLDNKLYKLEQRIDLLERKSGVGSSSGYSWQS